MPLCNITGCFHKRKSTSGDTKYISDAWLLFGICPCCALELFPQGLENKKGLPIYFPISINCRISIQAELKQLETEQRRKLAKLTIVSTSETNTLDLK